MSNEDHKKVQERGAQAFRRLIIWPSGALLITILLLVIHKPLIAALVAAFGVYYTSTKTLPAILNRHISKMIQASEYEGAEKMARFGVWWCRTLKLESISNLPRSFSWDILMKKHLGQALLQQGRFEESIATNKEIYQVLEVERDIAGSAAVIGSLAFCYIQTGQFSEATNLTSKSVMLLESAMRNAESSQDSKARAYRAQLGMALFEQATLLETRRQFEAAEPIRRKALAVTSKLYDDDDALQLMPHISMLGKVLIRLVRYEEAEPLLLKVQEVRAKHLPDKHILVASSKHGLGQLYCETDRFDLAEPYLVEALTTIEKTGGPDNPGIPEFKGSLAKLLLKKGEYAEAEKLLLEAIAQKERQSNSTHPDLIDLLLDLAEAKRQLGDPDGEKEIRARVKELFSALETDLT